MQILTRGLLYKFRRTTVIAIRFKIRKVIALFAISLIFLCPNDAASDEIVPKLSKPIILSPEFGELGAKPVATNIPKRDVFEVNEYYS
jgi:hypothetical protein